MSANHAKGLWVAKTKAPNMVDNVSDSTEVPLLATMGEMRAIRDALRPFTQGNQK